MSTKRTMLYGTSIALLGALLLPFATGARAYAAGSYNLLKNASFERMDASDATMSNCWQAGTSGTSTATYSRVHIPEEHSVTSTNTFEVRGGHSAQKVDITAYTSGNRKVVSKQHTSCAPTATAGYSYKTTAWMKGSGTARLVAYYYNGSSWVFLGNGPVVTLSGTWTEYEYATDALPAGATHLSVGTSLQSVGSMSVDSMTLQKNLAANPSMEQETAGTTNCWQQGSYGTNTAAWSRVADTHSFAAAERVDISAYTSGDRKLVTKQDTGTCAPALAQGHQYDTSIWVKGSGTARLITYYRTSGGVWTYWGQSAAVTLSSGWQKIRMVTPALSNGATHFSFGALLQSGGYMVIDDAQATDLRLLEDDFSSGANGINSVIANEFAYSNPTNANAIFDDTWGMDSGTLFYDSTNGAATTYTPDDCAGAAMVFDSSQCNNNQALRLWTNRPDFRNTITTADVYVNSQTSSTEFPAVAWDGLHVFLRRQNEHHLYYASVDRRDGTIAIKKKCPGGASNGGTYYQLASAGGNPGAYPIPLNTAHTVGASAYTEANGSVTVKLYRNGSQLLSANDNGSVGCAAITYPGGTGIRGDNTQFRLDNIRVDELQ